jgi:beta-xylosidase
MIVKNKRICCVIVILLTITHSIQAQKTIQSPIIPGYFADPTVIANKGKYFIYATIDPWGGDELAVFETTNFVQFKRHYLNWPTKQACTSPTSKTSKVWAPSVVKGKNGKFYMYVSVGGEIWGGVSDNPVGPWKNMKADGSPMITVKDFLLVHNIDADCFIDDDGQAYLYWGSGYKWVNGKCMAVKLEKDMVTFKGKPVEVTPADYFEGPHMIKRNNKYLLMFSSGKAIDSTYRIGYAIGDTPFGPFIKGLNSPILSTISGTKTIGPGHHTILKVKNQDYIFYHRIVPQKKEIVLRELCLDSLNYDSQGNIKKVNPIGVGKIQR